MREPNTGPLEGLNVRPANCIRNFLKLDETQIDALSVDQLKALILNAIKADTFGMQRRHKENGQYLRNLGRKSFNEILGWLGVEAPKSHRLGGIINCPHCNKPIIL